jgi:hypothetical protein
LQRNNIAPTRDVLACDLAADELDAASGTAPELELGAVGRHEGDVGTGDGRDVGADELYRELAGGETLARLPVTTTAAALAETGKVRTSKRIDVVLVPLFGDDQERASIVDRLMELRHAVADTLVITDGAIGFAHGALPSGKALKIDNGSLSESCLGPANGDVIR